jgi:protein-S-isoprenylcysteine O-methyltransferase Ste14
VLHSILAAGSVKARLPFGRAYRLAYNGFAIITFGGVWWTGRALLGDAPPLAVPQYCALAGNVVMVAGAVIILVALFGYDGGRFLGTTQVKSAEAPEDEPLRTDGLHRYVRHPLYSGLFLILWGHAQTELAIATAVWASLYLLIGTWFEERRLIDRYGDAYRNYRARVPAYVPWRGRVSAAD